LNNNYITNNWTSFSAGFVSGLISKELAYNWTLTFDEVINNIWSSYNLVLNNNINTTNILNWFAKNTFERFYDLRFLSIDNNYVYYADIKNQDKIYRVVITSDLLNFPLDYYTVDYNIIFSNKLNFNHTLFNSWEYINISEYNNYELVQSFSWDIIDDNYSISANIFQSLWKYELNYKFDQITWERIMNLPWNPVYTELEYVYYWNIEDSNKLYRANLQWSEIWNKIIDIEWININYTDSQYIYYNNPIDSYKLYKIRKDGSEINSWWTKIVNIPYSRSYYGDEEYVYFSNSYDGNKLYRIKKDWSEIDFWGTKIININNPQVLFYEWNYLYYINPLGYKLYKIKKDWSEIQTWWTKILDAGYFVYVLNDDWHIYYNNSRDGYNLYRIKKDWSDWNTFWTKVAKQSDIFFWRISSILYEWDYIYYTDASKRNKIYKIKKDGTEYDIWWTQITSWGNRILFLDWDCIYYITQTEYWNIYKSKKDWSEYNTEWTKINGINGYYINNDENYIYYYVSNNWYEYYKVKKDGTDEHLFLEKTPYISAWIVLDSWVEEIKIKIDSIIPTGTDYKFYLSDDNSNFIEIDKSLLTWNSKINLPSILWLFFNKTIYYKIELIWNYNDTTLTPIINSVEVSLWNEELVYLSDIKVTWSNGCSDWDYHTVYLNLYKTDSNWEKSIFYSNSQGYYYPTIWCASWGRLWWSKYTKHTCELLNITSNWSNSLVNYKCTIYESRSSSAAWWDWWEKYIYTYWSFTINSDLCSYDQEFCVSEILPPINLKQYVQSPYLERDTIDPWEKIWKFQSGSWIILTADIQNNNQEELRLAVDIYKTWDNLPFETFYTEYTTSSWTIEKILPYLWAWDYYWKARIESINWTSSDSIDFWTDNLWEFDFSLFEGFEPYPYGYNFPNSSPAEWVLTWGISGINLLGFDNRGKVPWNKWEIFESVYPISAFWNNEKKQIDAFEMLWLNEVRPQIFHIWNCFWLSLSAINAYYKTQTLESEFLNFSNLLANSWTIWERIDAPIIGSWSLWNNDNIVFRTILAYQLYQKWAIYTELEDVSEKNHTATWILNMIKNNSNAPYLLTISWRTCYLKDFCPTQYHAVVPYKVEGNRIYLWDNNIQFPANDTDYAYNQYIEINDDWTWFSPYYNWWNFRWDYFENLTIVDINEMYNLEEWTVMWFNNNDKLIAISWNSEMYLEDSFWNISWFYNWEVLEEIPWSIVIKTLNLSLSWTINNTWKQIYLPQKQENLTLKVVWKKDENYDLMIAWWDYYTKVSWVETSLWQVDTFNSTINNLKINFDDIKTWSYNILTDNFQESNTGTIYIDQVPININPQQYTIDWTWVVNNNSNAINYEIDANNDWIYNWTWDIITSLPPVFSDDVATITQISFSWTQTSNSTGNSYIETTSITLQATDNEWWSWLDTIYYSLDNTGITDKVYLPYINPIVINWVNEYTLSYYSIDKFWNQENEQTVNFILTKMPETYSWKISWNVYDDNNNNWTKDDWEKLMAWWKICIDLNDDWDCQENSESFVLTNNNWYYEFTSLPTWVYKIIEIPHQNWNITSPITNYYNIDLWNGQIVNGKDFGNYKIKGK
jgi:hypothetical protein